MRSGVPEWLPEVEDAVLVDLAPNEQVLGELRDMASHAVLTVPLVSRGRVLGAVTVGDPPARRRRPGLLADLAARAAVALDNALLYRAERRTGLTLQRSLLPGDVPSAARHRGRRPLPRRAPRAPSSAATGTRASSSATTSCCAWAT